MLYIELVGVGESCVRIGEERSLRDLWGNDRLTGKLVSLSCFQVRVLDPTKNKCLRSPLSSDRMRCHIKRAESRQ